MDIYRNLAADASAGRKKFAVLIDPDNSSFSLIDEIIRLSVHSSVDYFFIGGSLIINDLLPAVVNKIREACNIPAILFPGNNLQLNEQANGILLLSMISGRNPDLLIGRHVISAPYLKASKLEILPTGYMLVDGGRMTTVAYMSNTIPIPADKVKIAVSTAIAGEMLGLKLIYMDAGSGALNPVPAEMISAVRAQTEVPLIIGGGITSEETAVTAYQAGADVIVVGNAIEQNRALIPIIAAVRNHAETPTK